MEGHDRWWSKKLWSSDIERVKPSSLIIDFYEFKFANRLFANIMIKLYLRKNCVGNTLPIHFPFC